MRVFTSLAGVFPLPGVFLGFAACATLSAETLRWGINGHPLKQEGYWHVPIADQLDLVRESGAGWYRISFATEDFQANTARFEELLRQAEDRKLRLLPVLMPSADLFDGSASLAQIRGEAADFGRTMASRYKGRITHWELGNEFDHHAMIRKGETTRSGQAWIWDAPDGSSPDHYETTRYERSREFIRGLGEGIRNGDPAALTVVDTAGWLHYGFIDRLKEDGVAGFDILAWHWYSEMGDMTAVEGKLDLVKLLNDRYGKPLWITEINRRDGSKGGNEAAQAEYFRTSLHALANNPAIRALFVYELLDEPYFGDSAESHYGLVTVTKNDSAKWRADARKPAFGEFQRLVEACRRNSPAAAD